MNEYEYLWYGDPFGSFYENFIPEISMTFQFYHMIVDTCELSQLSNDYWIYCWYQGCFPRQVWSNLRSQWLYILRDLNDTAIVWYTNRQEYATDGGQDLQEVSEEQQQQWYDLAEAGGRTVAEILHDLTGFHRIPLSEQV